MSGDPPPRTPARENWRHVAADGGRAVLLFVICVGIGFAINTLRGHPLPWAYRSPTERLQTAVSALRDSPPSIAPPSSAHKAGPQTIDLEPFQALVFDQQGVVVDARAAAFYRQGHIPGAINLPREDFSTVYPTLAATLESRKGKTIAVYCSEPDCPDAGLVADALLGLGYPSVMVYKEGWEEWTRAGLPQESGPR